MVLVCFLLDLRSLSPPLLRDIKQSLLQMANFYTISSNWRNKLDSLRDRIGLCYVIKNRISSSDELKVAYGPRGDYSLRDFHHAVNSLPTDSFSPVINESGSISCYGLALSLSRCFGQKTGSEMKNLLGFDINVTTIFKI